MDGLVRKGILLVRITWLIVSWRKYPNTIFTFVSKINFEKMYGGQG